jgi:hypothetical protein
MLIAAACCSTECKTCYQYQSAAGETCVSKPYNDPCWGAATRGYCNMLTALVAKYAFNSTVVSARLAVVASALLADQLFHVSVSR